MEVVKLKTYSERDSEEIKAILNRMQKLHAEGKVKELVVVYLDDEGTSRAVLSDSTRMSSLAFFIEYLRHHLSKWLEKRE